MWFRVGGFLGLTADGPWRAKTVVLAALTALVGLGFWGYSVVTVHPPPGPDVPAFNELGQPTTGTQFDWSKPVPRFVRVALSYVGGFFIGWTFRRFLALALALVMVVGALLAFGKYMGWDTSAAREQVKRGSEWAQREAVSARDQLQRLLPSAFAGGAGVFLGFRRRNRGAAAPAVKP